MAFNMPERDTLAKLGTAGLTDVRALATDEILEIKASVTPETITDEQASALESLTAGIEFIDAQLDAAAKRAATYNKEIPARPEPVQVVEASAPAETEFVDGVKDVSATTPAPAVDGQGSDVVSATVTAATAVRSSGTVADVAQYVPLPEDTAGTADEEKFSIVAAAPLSLGRKGRLNTEDVTDWDKLGVAFDELARGHEGLKKVSNGQRIYKSDPIATVRRNAHAGRVILDRDNHETAFAKLQEVTKDYGQQIAAGRTSLEAAVAWCAPSPPDYSICSPITSDGLLQAPEMVLNRGGLLHNQGLDFSDFFNGDFTLPIPGYNILTEAQVIADTPKTCLEIPCPSFVDDRLNVAALCLTGSLLQNRGYPEFVSTFVQGATAAMAHLVNREIVNAIQTASTAVALAAVQPWTSDGSVLSQVLSAVEMGVMDMRYAYRTSRTQRFDVVFPFWLRAQLRADYIRQNARVSEDLADAEIDAMLSRRGANAQWIYDWQDAFNPGALAAGVQAGVVGGITALPATLGFLMYLPGTWVIGRQDVIRLNLVYDSVGLAQNQVTQVFVEDGFKPMQMCPFSRYYTINICPTGSTGVQRAVVCA
jgi:hypothetical protein